jgi:hypothetical protein
MYSAPVRAKKDAGAPGHPTGNQEWVIPSAHTFARAAPSHTFAGLLE